MKDPGSTSSKLILRLVGPSTVLGRGVAFTFVGAPAMADVVKVDDSDAEFVQNGDVFALGEAPRLHKGLHQDGRLRVTVSQKGQGMAKPMDATILKLALQFKPAANLGAGTVIPISVTEGQLLPASGGPASMTVSVGSLRAQ